MQHDDRTLVALGGHFHEPSVLSDLQVDADAIHHAGHRLDLGAKRKLQLFDCGVVVLARVEHGAVLILAIGKVDEMIGEDPDGGPSAEENEVAEDMRGASVSSSIVRQRKPRRPWRGRH